MTNGHQKDYGIDLYIKTCEQCNAPVIEMVAAGGARDGDKLEAHLNVGTTATIAITLLAHMIHSGHAPEALAAVSRVRRMFRGST